MTIWASVTHSYPSRHSQNGVHTPHHWRGGDERERERQTEKLSEGLKIGRSDRSRTTWTAVKGPQCWGQNGCCSFAVDTTSEGRGPPMSGNYIRQKRNTQASTPKPQTLKENGKRAAQPHSSCLERTPLQLNPTGASH
jgi:hypothetical protein